MPARFASYTGISFTEDKIVSKSVSVTWMTFCIFFERFSVGFIFCGSSSHVNWSSGKEFMYSIAGESVLQM